jgi:AcrR family transcriptional regulator
MPASATRERILGAAIEEFAAHGYAGARIARIASGARANKERIYHHYGSKEGLFEAALDEAMRQIVAAEPFNAEDLGAYVGSMLAFHRANPELLRLLLAEGEVRRPAERRAHYAWRAEAVRRAQDAGILRAGVDPRVVVFLVLAAVVTAEALPGVTELLLGDADLQGGMHALLNG